MDDGSPLSSSSSTSTTTTTTTTTSTPIRTVKRSSVGLLDHSRITGRFNTNLFINRRLTQCGLAVHCHDLIGHFACVNTISFSNGDQSLLVSGGDDERVLIWRMLENPGKKQYIKEFKGHMSNIFHAIFNKSNTHILSCANDHSIKYYDIEGHTNLPIDSFDSHNEAVYRLSFCPTNENLFLSAIYLWDLREKRKPKTLIRSQGAFRSIQWAPQGHFYVTSNKRCGVQLWDVRAPVVPRFIGGSTVAEPLVQYVSRFRHASGAVFNSQGTHIIASIEKDGPAMYELSSTFATQVFTDPKYKNSCTIKSATFIGNYDEFVACGSDDFRIYIWNTPGKSDPVSPTKSTIDNNNNNNNYDPNNNNKYTTAYKYFNSEDKKVTKHAHTILEGHRSIVNNLAWNSSLGVLCSSGVEKMVKVWSTFETNEEDSQPRVHEPRKPHPIYYFDATEDRYEGTVEESPNTLGLFDFLLQIEESSARKKKDGGVLMPRSAGYGEDLRHSAEVTYTFEIQDSESSSDEDDSDASDMLDPADALLSAYGLDEGIEFTYSEESSDEDDDGVLGWPRSRAPIKYSSDEEEVDDELPNLRDLEKEASSNKKKSNTKRKTTKLTKADKGSDDEEEKLDTEGEGEGAVDKGKEKPEKRRKK